MSEKATTTPAEQLLAAVKAILAYPGMSDFIAANGEYAAFGIMTADLAALKAAVEVVEAALNAT